MIDISADDLQDHLLQYPEYSSNIHCRFFPFWPPRDVDLMQWLSHWIKQGKSSFFLRNFTSNVPIRCLARRCYEYGSCTYIKIIESFILATSSYLWYRTACYLPHESNSNSIASTSLRTAHCRFDNFDISSRYSSTILSFADIINTVDSIERIC